MDKVCEELDEAKAGIEKLKSENRRKEELYESLKKSQNEQLVKIKEANLKLEKLAQELIEKEGEISVTKHTCEDLRCSLSEKESIVKHLKAANDKLRVDCDEKSKKWEEENRVLVLALDEAKEKNMDHEQKIYAFEEEIEGLKGLLAVSQKKCSEAEKRTKAAKELREGDRTLLDLEEENRKIENQLKWKKEQFKHLEEAHERLRERFKTSEKEWETEKSTLIDEISSLQTRLDSQTRISEDLQKRLEMCHQALAHEESRRKHLEVQVSEFQTRFENAFAECQDAEAGVDCFTGRREEEIGTLRNTLGKKEMLYKEMEYQLQKLEQENQELLKSIKELHEAQIHESGSKSSLPKLRIKLKAVEQKYRDCSNDLKTKEAEWSVQLKEVLRDLNDCKSELESKDKSIQELMSELAGCRSLITQLKKLQTEESEWSSQLEKMRKDFNDCRSELESKDTAISELMAELEGCHSLITQLKLQIGESEWSSQLENLRKDLNDCKSELESKDRAVEELMAELEGCHSLIAQLKLQTEESSQLEKMRKEMNDCKSELESKDRAIEELMAELEGCHSLTTQLKKLQTEESQWISQLEKMRKDFNDCKSELECKDRAIEELMAELEGFHSLTTQLKKLQTEESHWSSQLEKMRKDFNNCKSELECKDRAIEELMTELEGCYSLTTQLKKLQTEESQWSSELEKMRKDFNNCKSELECKDTAIEELMVELENYHSLMTQLRLQNDDSSSQLEKMRRDFNACRSELDSKDRVIEELTVALKLQVQEPEWSSRLESMKKDLNECRSELKSKDRAIEDLLTELGDCHSQREKMVSDFNDCRSEIECKDRVTEELMLQNEETSVMLMILKSVISEAQLKVVNDENERELLEKEKDEKMKALLMTIETLKERQFVMEKELGRHKTMLSEASSALERANSELGQKICEGNEIEFELQIWKSFAKRLKVNLEEIYEMRKELEDSLLEQVEFEETFKQEKSSLILELGEKNRRIDSLQQQIVALDQELKTRETEAASSARAETETSSENKMILEDLRKQLGLLEQEKNQRIDDLTHLVTSLEEKHKSSLASFSAQLSEKQAKINLVSESWEKIASAEILSVLEIEEKKLMIVELEDEIQNIQQKLEVQDKSLYATKQQALEIESELEAKQSEMERLTREINELKSEKQNLVDNNNYLLSKQESLCCFLGEIDDKIDNLALEDVHLMETLGKMVQSFDTNEAEEVDLKRSAGLFGSTKENITSPRTKTIEVTPNGRSPFREVNI